MKIDEIDLNKEYKAIELLNLIRARTLHHMSQHFFDKDGKKFCQT